MERRGRRPGRTTLIAVLFAVVVLSAAGWTLTAAIDPTLRWRAKAGLGFLMGAGANALVLLLLSLAGLRWSRLTLAGMLLIITVAAVGVRWRRRPSEKNACAMPPSGWETRAADAGTAAVLFAYAVYCTLAAPWEMDFWATWGGKGRAFFETLAIDWTFLQRPLNAFTHPAYPPLVPLLYDAVAVIEGAWRDRWLGALSAAFAIAIVLVIRDLLEEETASPQFAAVATLAISPAACSLWVGIAEPPMIAYATAAVLLLRRGLARGRTETLVLAGVVLGFCALAKNEGKGLLLVAVLAILASRGAARALLAPAVGLGISSVWMVASAFHGLTDVLVAAPRRGDVILGRIADLEPLRVVAGKTSPAVWIWFTTVALVVFLARRAVVVRERFLWLIVLLQLAMYVSIYVITPHDVPWHVNASWPRVVTHVQLLAGYLGAIAVAALLSRKTGSSEVQGEGPPPQEKAGGP